MYFEIKDNTIPEDFRQQVWDYLLDQIWHVYTRIEKKMYFFTPSKDGLNYPSTVKNAMHGVMMTRTVLGVDEPNLKQNHPIISELWEKINHQFGDLYEISGPAEGCASDTHPDWIPPPSVIPNTAMGWRVYTNGTPSERYKRSHGVHRDTIDMHDDSTVTFLYVANMEWYPSWMAEILFYDEDPGGETGDHQQFQKSPGGYAQKRNFNIGWPSKIGSAVPGRVIAYDGRTLHTTKPAADWVDTQRVTLAFRARLKK